MAPSETRAREHKQRERLHVTGLEHLESLTASSPGLYPCPVPFPLRFIVLAGSLLWGRGALSLSVGWGLVAPALVCQALRAGCLRDCSTRSS